MIYVGIDDTDTLDDPGTNQLARHMVRELAGQYLGRMILRHQLLEDPRVPCTRKNGCASIFLEPAAGNSNSQSITPAAQADRIASLANALRDIIIPWCPAGSDPGLCITHDVPSAVTGWGMRCKRELVTQSEARRIAAEHGIYLVGLGGTEDGVIGALAAVGSMETRNDGRVVYFGGTNADWFDVTGCLAVEDILARGVEEVRSIGREDLVTSGTVAVGKRLRPNYRNGKIVLFVEESATPPWTAVRVT
jgi:tRNA(Ile2) C34 agmatinyltransferase TiaS